MLYKFSVSEILIYLICNWYFLKGDKILKRTVSDNNMGNLNLSNELKPNYVITNFIVQFYMLFNDPIKVCFNEGNIRIKQRPTINLSNLQW